MNKIEMTIDMKDDCLQFSSFEAHIKAFIKAHSTVLSSKKIAIEQKSSISTQILKRFISSVVTQLSEKSSSFSKIVKSVTSISRLNRASQCLQLRSDSDLTQFLFSFLNISLFNITFYSCHKHIFFKLSAVSEYYLNRSSCTHLLLYS